jgi:predicted methyltransferase
MEDDGAATRSQSHMEKKTIGLSATLRHGAITGVAIVCAMAVNCVWRASAQEVPDYPALMAAPDRSDADRQADKRRDPVPLLAFAGLRGGMKVLDMGAGAGYSTELVARVIGPSGVGQNPPDNFERARNALAARAATPAMRNSVALVRPYDDPVPADVHDLGMITFLFFYHDTTYLNVDRAQMNRKLLAVLKPGGVLVIADHSAKANGHLSRQDAPSDRREPAAPRDRGGRLQTRCRGNFWRSPTIAAISRRYGPPVQWTILY